MTERSQAMVPIEVPFDELYAIAEKRGFEVVSFEGNMAAFRRIAISRSFGCAAITSDLVAEKHWDGRESVLVPKSDIANFMRIFSEE